MSCGCNCGTAVVKVDCEGMCVDGLSAYELWAQNQSPDTDTSMAAFWNFLKGVSVVDITVEVNDVKV